MGCINTKKNPEKYTIKIEHKNNKSDVPKDKYSSSEDKNRFSKKNIKDNDSNSNQIVDNIYINVCLDYQEITSQNQNNTNYKMCSINTKISASNDNTIKKGSKNIKGVLSQQKQYSSQNNQSQSKYNINSNDNQINKTGENIPHMDYQNQSLFNSIEMGKLDKEKQDQLEYKNELLNINQLMLQNGKHLKLINDTESKQISEILVKNNYIIINYLNSGGQGDIFIAKQNEQQVVIKIYHGIDEKKFDEEVDLINSIKEPINILGNIETIKLADINVYIIVQKQCKLSLREEIDQFKSKQKEFTELNLLIITFDLLDGLIEMRSHNIIHQDIKPANILKTHSGKYVYTDFGMSSKLKDGKAEFKGYTINYCAPEQLQGDIDYQSDVYSLGKTLQVVIEAYQVNQNQSNKAKLKSIKSINSFKILIKQKMINNVKKDREEIMELLKEFFKIVKKREFFQFCLKYKEKLNQISQMFPFDNNKDIHYFSQIHIQYCLIYYDCLFFMKKLFEDNNSLNNLKISNIQGKEIIYCLNNIGNCYLSLSEYNLALKFFLESLEINKNYFSDNHQSISDCLNSLGNCYYSLGEYIQAQRYYFESLEMNKILFSGNHSSIADCLNSLGNCYLQRDQYHLALNFLFQSLEMRKILFSGNHSSIADCLKSLGNCYLSRDQDPLAQKFFFESLEVNKILFSGNHSNIADFLNKIGICYLSQHQYLQAQNFMFQSLEMWKILFSGNHSSIADCLNSLGNCYLSTGQYDLAEKFLFESLQMKKMVFSGNHSSIAYCLKSIGNFHYQQGKIDLAIKFYQQSIEMNKTVFSGRHSSVADCQYRVGNCYKLKKEKDLAQKFYQQALEMNQNLYQYVKYFSKAEQEY